MIANLIGHQIEHYRIEGVIGEGGMGTVYRAVDINLARPVAVKVMHTHYAVQNEFQQRFQQEAQAAARSRAPLYCSCLSLWPGTRLFIHCHGTWSLASVWALI